MKNIFLRLTLAAIFFSCVATLADAQTIRTRAYLDTRFETGDFPTATDYKDWRASFWHVTEDTIPVTNLVGVDELSNDVALADSSSRALVTEAAVKAYVDAVGAGSSLTDGDKGAIVVSGGATVWNIDTDAVGSAEIATGAVGTSEIANGSVANADLATMPANTIKGNNTAGAISPVDLTTAQVKTLLDIQTTDLSDFAEAVEDKIGTKVVAGGGITVAYDDGTGETTISGTGLSDGDKTDITVSGAGATWTIDNDAVTLAKQASGTANRLQVFDASGNPAEGTVTGLATLSSGVLNVTGDGTGTDDQTIDVFSLTGTTLNLSLESDGEATKTVDLSSLQGAVDTIYILQSGQSNSFGASSVLAGVDTARTSNVEIWDFVGGSNTWKVATIGQNPYRNAGYNQGAAAGYNGSNNATFHFAKKLASETGKHVRIIPAYFDGNAIAQWTDGAKPNLDSITTRVIAAGSPEIDIFIWQQGEADQATAAATYITKFDTLIANLDTYTWFTSNTKIILGGLYKGAGATSNAKDTTLQQIADRTDLRVGYAQSSGLTADPLSFQHFSGASNQILGEEKMWNAYNFLPRQPLSVSERAFNVSGSNAYRVGKTSIGTSTNSLNNALLVEDSSSSVNNQVTVKNNHATGTSGINISGNLGSNGLFFGYNNSTQRSFINTYTGKPLDLTYNGTTVASLLNNGVTIGSTGLTNGVLTLSQNQTSLNYAIKVQNTNTAGLDAIYFADPTDANGLLIGYGNASHAHYPNRAFINTFVGKAISLGSGNVSFFYVGGTGNIGIGTTSPTAKLHLPAGTATASTAPLKFTSGTNLTTPEAGTMEYNGDLYFTDSDATRQAVILSGGNDIAGAVVIGTNDDNNFVLERNNAAAVTIGSGGSLTANAYTSSSAFAGTTSHFVTQNSSGQLLTKSASTFRQELNLYGTGASFTVTSSTTQDTIKDLAGTTTSNIAAKFTRIDNMVTATLSYLVYTQAGVISATHTYDPPVGLASDFTASTDVSLVGGGVIQTEVFNTGYAGSRVMLVAPDTVNDEIDAGIYYGNATGAPAHPGNRYRVDITFIYVIN